ncbi:MAG: hypothetical protein LAT64_09500 [Phycisphaerales bacterium]|nr:hypothetical protein [Planctomycetota bacterium]MCH8508982.1 hypothetical protein [Phycisphaerales bacterium]
MDPISPAIPFHAAARAYGVRPAAAPQPVQAVQQPTSTEPLARIGRPAEPRPAADPSRVVAAQVAPIDLTRDVAEIAGKPASDGTLPLYRHPADRNQAATAIALGRALDVKG